MLSNFLGRGTDAIECLLLERKCVGVDVNPVAVKLARKNTSFRLPKDGSVTMEFRPLLLLGDSRHLDGGAFQNESFDHVLSHPPYKDCVAYSTDIEGDVSRFPLMDDFQREIALIASASWRVLKWNGRCTLAIGDNRRDCFYQPVSFQTCETYMKQGFEIEELVSLQYCNAC